MTEQTTAKNPSREDAPDATGLVRRAEAAERVREYAEQFGEAPPCFCGDFGCERPAIMQVYGLMMCEEAASGALEELILHVEWEATRPLNPHLSGLNPDLEAALKQVTETLSAELQGAGWPDDELLVRAFPLDRKRVDVETLAYVENPEAGRGCSPPLDNFLEDRRLVCRYMREAFEAGADWLVEMLEAAREKVAAKAAYALALEREAETRPA